MCANAQNFVVRAHQTANYTWTSENQLGRGSVGQVFVGYRKKTAEKVAIKVLKDIQSMQREVEALRKLPMHENLVAFYGIERESTGAYVMAMELCNGGSLFDVIDSAQYAFGLDEDQFKRVVSDVAEGMAHLKSQRIAHRDIKPGNIMRCRKVDGSYVFKLIDFGTAREIQPQAEFSTIVGTEEFLHPEMYRCYFERASMDKRRFKDKVDLWSVGVTFYQVATGRLPFEPFHKRKDRETMKKITSEKPQGVISGRQEEEDGEICYSKEMPHNTLISMGLKALMTPVLAGILEKDFGKMWEFDKFFQVIRNIEKMKVVDIFYIQHCSLHKVYLQPNLESGLSVLKKAISQQTGLRTDQMELFYQNVPYSPKPGTVTVQELPDTTPDSPITVYGGETLKEHEIKDPKLLADIQEPSISGNGSIEDTHTYAKKCSRMLWAHLHTVKTLVQMHKLMLQSAKCLGQVVKHELSLLEQQTERVTVLNAAVCRMLEGHNTHLCELSLLCTPSQSIKGIVESEYQQIQLEVQSNKKELVELRKESQSIKEQMQLAKTQASEVIDNPVLLRNTESLDFDIAVVEFCVERGGKLVSEIQNIKRKPSRNEIDSVVCASDYKELSEIYDKVQTKTAMLLQKRCGLYKSLHHYLGTCVPLREEANGMKESLTYYSREYDRKVEDLEKRSCEHRKLVEKMRTKMSEAMAISNATTAVPGSSFGTRLPQDVISKLQQLERQMSSLRQVVEAQELTVRQISVEQ